jgi:hypothetical protein
VVLVSPHRDAFCPLLGKRHLLILTDIEEERNIDQESIEAGSASCCGILVILFYCVFTLTFIAFFPDPSAL